jgi:carbonic anhydrase
MILSSKNSSDGMQLTLGKLFPQDLDVFFRYEELMMDPSCQAHVSWTVFPTPARLPVKEVSSFTRDL